jgi:hypothetical protein
MQTMQAMQARRVHHLLEVSTTKSKAPSSSICSYLPRRRRGHHHHLHVFHLHVFHLHVFHLHVFLKKHHQIVRTRALNRV